MGDDDGGVVDAQPKPASATITVAAVKIRLENLFIGMKTVLRFASLVMGKQ
jgi:hypothetical protein